MMLMLIIYTLSFITVNSGLYEDYEAALDNVDTNGNTEATKLKSRVLGLAKKLDERGGTNANIISLSSSLIPNIPGLASDDPMKITSSALTIASNLASILVPPPFNIAVSTALSLVGAVFGLGVAKESQSSILNNAVNQIKAALIDQDIRGLQSEMVAMEGDYNTYQSDLFNYNAIIGGDECYDLTTWNDFKTRAYIVRDADNVIDKVKSYIKSVISTNSEYSVKATQLLAGFFLMLGKREVVLLQYIAVVAYQYDHCGKKNADKALYKTLRTASEELLDDAEEIMKYIQECANTKQMYVIMEMRGLNQFRIKTRDPKNCYLTIGNGAYNEDGVSLCNCHDLTSFQTEKDAFWDCTNKGSVWSYDGNILYTIALGKKWYLEDDWDKGQGLEIDSHERNAKVDADNADKIYFTKNGKQIAYIYDNDGKKCELQWDYDSHYYQTIDNVKVSGHEAKFDCYYYDVQPYDIVYETQTGGIIFSWFNRTIRNKVYNNLPLLSIGSTYGKWGEHSSSWSMCDENSFVQSIDKQIDIDAGNCPDRAGLSNIKMKCINNAKNIAENSKELGINKDWGEWDYSLKCDSNHYLISILNCIHPHQTGNNDDLGQFDLHGRCTNGLQQPETNTYCSWDWTKESRCPIGFAICGLVVRYESFQGDGGCGSSDDTAITEVAAKCCSLDNWSQQIML